MLATERYVSASTHNQALSALLFLYREVLEVDLPWLTNINRPTQTKSLPSVLTKDEVAGVLAVPAGIPRKGRNQSDKMTRRQRLLAASMSSVIGHLY